MATTKHVLWCFVCERNFDGYTGELIDLREYEAIQNKIITSGMCPECQEIDDKRAERIVPALIGVEEEMYVIVNKSCGGNGAYNICVDDEPVTYPDLETAVRGLVKLIEDYDHTPMTARIYRLLPVGMTRIHRAMAIKKAIDKEKMKDE